MNRLIGILFIHLLASISYAAGPTSQMVTFTLECNVTETTIGTPVVVRLGIKNHGTQAYVFPSRIGYSQGLSLYSAKGAGEFAGIRLDVPHVDTDLGAMPRPTYEFGGKVAPGGSQFILHFIGTNGLQAGVLRLKAAIQLKQDEIESNTVSVVLTEPAEKPPQVFTPDEFVIIHNQVTPAHNLFRGRSGNPELNKVAGELVQKAMQAANATTDCEYALYFAVLQCADKDASPEETVLADRACSALVRLFPKSWLRAHAFAALARRDLRRARQTIWEASKLAEAYPLLDNLGLHSF